MTSREPNKVGLKLNPSLRIRGGGRPTEIKLTFVYRGVEVSITADSVNGLEAELKKLTKTLDEGLGTKAGIVIGPPSAEGQVFVAPSPQPTSLEGRIQSLASQTSMSVDELKRTVHFGEEFPLLLKTVEAAVRTKQQAKALLALGAILDIVYQKPEVGSELYGKLLRDSNVDNQRLDHAMAGLKGMFIGKGAGRGRSYEITVPGRTGGLEAVKELAQQQS